jgi:hypothetical protein
VLCLCPRGKYRVPKQAEERSRLGFTAELLSWTVIELWALSADDLLAAPDVGVVPWVPMARYDGPPEMLLQRCRDRIESEGGAHRANLLAVTQVYAKLHFDKPEWLNILGGRKAMNASPLIQDIVTESERAGQVALILHILQGKFGPVVPAITAGLAQVKEVEQIKRLGLHAATCGSLHAFEEKLHQELPAPAPASTRGKRRSRKPPT